MTTTQISVGILVPSVEARQLVCSQVSSTGLASVAVESDQYCAVAGDRVACRFIEVRPDIILIDMQDLQAGIQSLTTLQAALPETRLFAMSENSDSELIIETMRAGAREFLPKPITRLCLAQAFSRYSAERQRQPQTRGEGKLYGFTAAKEGSGATCIAINTASSLAAQENTKVALLDLNSPLGDAATYLNLSPKFTVSEALTEASRLDEVLLESYMSPAVGFAVLPGPREFGPLHMPPAEALGKLLEVAAQTYTHAMIDLPVALPEEHLQVVAEMVAELVVVLTPELSSISRTGRLLRRLSACGADKHVRLVINRSRNTDEFTESEIEKVLRHAVYHRMPNNYKDSVKAIDSGRPLTRANNSELVRRYDELACRLAGIPLSQKRGWLSSLRT